MNITSHRRDNYISIGTGEEYWTRKTLAPLQNLSALANAGLNFSEYGLNLRNVEAFVYTVRTDGFKYILDKKRPMWLLRKMAKYSVVFWNRVNVIFSTRCCPTQRIYINGWVMKHNSLGVWQGPERYVELGKFDTCRKANCIPGRFQTFQNQRYPEETPWNHSIGRSCIKCPENTVKPTYGDTPCHLCPSLTVSNKQKTYCYDPYRLSFASVSDLPVQIFLSISILLALLITGIIIILIVYRETPVARCIDFYVSVIHLTLQLLITLCNVYSF